MSVFQFLIVSSSSSVFPVFPSFVFHVSSYSRILVISCSSESCVSFLASHVCSSSCLHVCLHFVYVKFVCLSLHLCLNFVLFG